MRSKGGKIFYRCNKCYSADIAKGLLEHNGKRINVFICNTCNVYGYWEHRIKESVIKHYDSIYTSIICQMNKRDAIVMPQKFVLKNLGKRKLNNISPSWMAGYLKDNK